MESPINTDNIYKFLTTISLAGVIYSFAFGSLYIDPYSEKITDLNLKTADVGADYYYFDSKRRDLKKEVQSIDKIPKFRYNASFGSDVKSPIVDSIYYYQTGGMDDSGKRIIDSINIIEKKFALASYKLNSLREAQFTLSYNIERDIFINVILKIFFSIFFIVSLLKWYKYRKQIDK